MANEPMIQNLVRMRGAVGAGAWLAPRFSGRLFGLDPNANPQAPYLGRLFGARDVALAFGLSTSSGSQRANWLRIGVACDLADAVAGVLAGRRGELPARATVLVTATALAAAALGIVALQSAESPGQTS
ncbi:MAG TPA: hypothetical protein VGF93_04240 [Solirubrobacteraceae bacterium]|jgi:hypothetical protein